MPVRKRKHPVNIEQFGQSLKKIILSDLRFFKKRCTLPDNNVNEVI